MPPYSKLRAPIAWSLFALTLLFTGFEMIFLLLAVFFNRVATHLLGPDTPSEPIPTKVWAMVGIGFATILLSLWLVRFYFVAARKTASVRSLAFGWVLSALYYAAITGLLVPYSPESTMQIGGVTMPTILITAAATAASLYILVALWRLAPPPPAPAPPLPPAA